MKKSNLADENSHQHALNLTKGFEYVTIVTINIQHIPFHWIISIEPHQSSSHMLYLLKHQITF